MIYFEEKIGGDRLRITWDEVVRDNLSLHLSKSCGPKQIGMDKKD